jgi:predicted phosphoadenosine phosphosulfate sulfurtransferase
LLAQTVLEAALERLCDLYAQGHRLVFSFSGGKDSGVCVELGIEAARRTGRLPVEVILRDEEILFPGTFEYAERLANRPEVQFHWVVAHQPIINVFNRAMPYWWVFDLALAPNQWLRQPPSWAEVIPDMNIQSMTNPTRFPPPADKRLYSVIGIRASESRLRRLAIHSTGGWLTRNPNPFVAYHARPVYDWQDGDIWRAIHEHGWDSNEAYTHLLRAGVAKWRLRIAPPSMSVSSLYLLQFAARLWPQWFDRVAERLPGIRTAVQFGKRAVEPQRRLGETWEQCFTRTCLTDAPAWIAERNARLLAKHLRIHAAHSSVPLPQVGNCPKCKLLHSWEKLAKGLYTGDPFSQKQDLLPPVEPSFFRPDGGTWGLAHPDERSESDHADTE